MEKCFFNQQGRKKHLGRKIVQKKKSFQGEKKNDVSMQVALAQTCRK